MCVLTWADEQGRSRQSYPLTLRIGVDAIFLVSFLSLFFVSPLILSGGQRRRGERAGEKRGEGHAAAHCPGKPLPPVLSSLCVFLGGWQWTSALRAVPRFPLCTLAWGVPYKSPQMRINY